MEPYIKNNVSDINYKSELTPHPVSTKQESLRKYLGVGFNSTIKLTFICIP